MNFAIVNNVNTVRSMRADFDIHRADCADLRKVSPADIELIEADSVDDVIAANIDDLEGGGFDRASAEMFSHHVLPCAH